MMPRSWHISTIFVSIGMARCGVSPVVLMPNLRSRGKLVEHHPADLDQVVPGRRLAARDVGVLDVLPEARAEGLLDLARASCRVLRSPRFQLLHISQRASQTNVQWKISTVGWMGLMRAT